MAKMKDALTKEAVRLRNTAENPNNSAQSIQAARTRWVNAHREYWDAVKKAWADIQAGRSIGKACVDAGGVDPEDVKEIARADN